MPHRKSAGRVKMIPEATEDDAEPIVWLMFASRRRVPFPDFSFGRRQTAKATTVRTATGIDVEMVRPTRSPRYAFAAPKRMPKIAPRKTARNVTSGGDADASI
jgi:hypothetical protein